MELNHSLGDTYHTYLKHPRTYFFSALIWANYFDSFHGVETDKPTSTGDGARTRIYRLERPIT